MADWKAQARLRTYEVPKFAFRGGETMDVRLAYRTLGELAPDGSNAVLMLHGTTGSSDQYLVDEAGDELFGKGGPLDVRSYFIVLPDAIGHGRSSKPSDGLGEAFPRYTYHDLVEAQHRIVTRDLGLERLRLVIGASMGGMHTWLWGCLYPDCIGALMPIASLPEPLSGRNLLFRRIMIDLIRADRSYPGSDGTDAPGLGRAWNVFDLVVGGASRLEASIEKPDAADAWLRNKQRQAMSKEHPVNAVWELEASIDYDPRPLLPRITAPLLALNFADDIINDSGFARLETVVSELPHAVSIIVPAAAGSNGHQRLRDAREWSGWLRHLLRDTEPAR